MPTVRSSVLLPDMFEPLTTITDPAAAETRKRKQEAFAQRKAVILSAIDKRDLFYAALERLSGDEHAAKERDRLEARYGKATVGEIAFSARETAFQTQHRAIEATPEGLTIPDVDGLIGSPFRAMDSVAILLRRKNITAEQANTASRFRDQFDRACLDQLKAPDLARVPVQGGVPVHDWSDGCEAARHWLAKRVRLLGGNAAPPASVMVDVVGFGDSMNAWCVRQGRRFGRRYEERVGRGILIGALEVLRVFEEGRR